VGLDFDHKDPMIRNDDDEVRLPLDLPYMVGEHE
jgi:hypothetical protein